MSPGFTKPLEIFDKAYMNKLFDLGYSLSMKGYAWQDKPPGFKE